MSVHTLFIEEYYQKINCLKVSLTIKSYSAVYLQYFEIKQSLYFLKLMLRSFSIKCTCYLKVIVPFKIFDFQDNLNFKGLN